MPRVIDIAQKVLGEVAANSLNTEECLSAEEFLRKYDAVKETNKYTVGEKVISSSHVVEWQCMFCKRIFS